MEEEEEVRLGVVCVEREEEDEDEGSDETWGETGRLPLLLLRIREAGAAIEGALLEECLAVAEPPATAHRKTPLFATVPHSGRRGS